MWNVGTYRVNCQFAPQTPGTAPRHPKHGLESPNCASFNLASLTVVQPEEIIKQDDEMNV